MNFIAALQLTGDPAADILAYEAHERALAEGAVVAQSDTLDRTVERAEEGPVSATVLVSDRGSEDPIVVGWQASTTVEDRLHEEATNEEATNEPPIFEEEVPMGMSQYVVENGDNATLEVLFEEGATASLLEEEVAAPQPVVTESGVNLGFTGQVGTRKEKHSRLVLDGACAKCAHCAMNLTDAVSIERGIGPICSHRGYLDVEPVEPDEMHAMIVLSDWPELCQHLADNWRPKGIRGLMNGLVRVCSLNRRSAVHKACTDAIELLGYKQLANTLRESLAVVSIKHSETEPGFVEVWVKRGEWNRTYGDQVFQIFGAKWVPHPSSKSGKRGKLLIPVEMPAEGDRPAMKIYTFVTSRPDEEGRVVKRIHWAPDGAEKVSNSYLLWHLLVQHYEGLIAKTDAGGVYIKPVPLKAIKPA